MTLGLKTKAAADKSPFAASIESSQSVDKTPSHTRHTDMSAEELTSDSVQGGVAIGGDMKSSFDVNTRHAACDCGRLCPVRKARATNVVCPWSVTEGANDRSELPPIRSITQRDLTTGQSRVDVATVSLNMSRIATTQIRLALFPSMMAALLCSLILGACGGGSDSDSNGAVGLANGTPYRSWVATPFDGRAVIGFQGWYGCPGDLPGNNAWFHWFNGTPSSKTMLTDMLPDTSI